MFRYFGSKASTASTIAELVRQLSPHGSVADAFGGLGTIGAELRSRGHDVTTCDVLTFPHYFQVSRIECGSRPSFKRVREEVGLNNIDELLASLNRRKAPNSWFVKEFARERGFFTYENAVRIAGTWHELVRWNDAGWLSKRERAYLVASFLNSMDAVANTAGTYYAYLRDFHRKALNSYHFELLPIGTGQRKGRALLGDALGSLSGKKFDVLYLDPPYNDRNYAGYYHLPESLALLRRPKTKPESLSGIPCSPHEGAANIRDGMTLQYLERIATEVDWRNLIVHYCDGALIPLDDMRKSLEKFGTVRELHISALGYTTKREARSTTHYVFVVTAPSH